VRSHYTIHRQRRLELVEASNIAIAFLLSIGWISSSCCFPRESPRHEVFIEVAEFKTGQRNSQPQIPLLGYIASLRITAFFEYLPSDHHRIGIDVRDNSSSARSVPK